MKKEENEKNRENWKLDRKEIEAEDINVTEAANLLYDIINESWVVSRDALQITVNKTSRSLQDLYSTCKELLEQIEYAGADRLSFLQMSVIEDCYSKAKQLVLVPLTELLNNDMSALERAIRMEKLLAQNPCKAMWTEKSSHYRALLEKMGFKVSTDDYTDLSAIMEPLLNAFTFYKGKRHQYPPTVCKVRSGVRSTKSPIFSLDTCMYGSELDFVTALENSREECLIAFGGIKKKNALQHNYFDRYLHDRDEERCRNLMHNRDMTFEEYMESTDDYASKIMLGVKAGECIYLVAMPITSTYGNITTSDSMYYYGKRSSYAPYQIFWKDAPVYPSDTTQVGFPDTGYRLTDILDDEQKIWLPVFLQETISHFFGADEIPHKDYLFHQELASLSPLSQEKTYPMCMNELSTQSTLLTIPAPEEILKENDLYLAQYFGITQDSLINVPVLPNEFIEVGKCNEIFKERCASAYKKEIANKICELSLTRRSTRANVNSIIRERLKDIWNELLDGKYDEFAEVTIEGTPILDKDGNPRYVEKWVKGERKQVPVTETMSVDDCKAWGNGHFAIIVNGCEQKKYPVCVRIRPVCAEHFSLILGKPVEELLPMLQLSKQLRTFHEDYRNFFSHLNNRDSWDDSKPTIHTQRFADINFCVSKKDWKQQDRYALLYENK